MKLFRPLVSALLAAGVFAAQAAPTVTATKDDNTAPGVRKIVGNNITYTITIGNTGTTDATGTLLTDPDPANTTFVSINSTPIARNDTYSAIGNVQISIAAPGVLVNDNDPDGVGPALTVSAFNPTSTGGGNVNVAANGSFTYNPAPGFSGNDTFTYTTTQFSVTAPANAASGTPFSVTVTARTASNAIATNYTGTVHFTKSDAGAGSVVPADYTFTAGDNGVHTFSNGVTFTTLGAQTITATDTVTASITGSAIVTVGAPGSGDPTATSRYSKGGAVPGAGSPGGVPAGATFASFGVPAINDNDTTTIAFLGKYKSPTGSGAALFAGPATGVTTIVKLNDTVPNTTGTPISGVVFKLFRDPVLARDGSIAFIAKINGPGVDGSSDYAIFTNAGGTLKMVARESDTLPDAPVGSKVKAFASASLSSDGGDAWVVFTASLFTGPSGGAGPGGVTTANDTGAWRWKASTGAITNIIREGSPLSSVGASNVKAFRLLKTSSGSPGQSRGQYAGANVTFQVLFVDKTQAIVDTDETGASKVFGSGEATVPGVTDATWKTLGPPAVPSVAGNGLAFLAQLNKDLGGVATANAKRLFFTPTAGTGAMVKITDIAPGLGGTAAFSAFKDPVLAPGGNLFAFAGTGKGGAITTANDLGIWQKSATGALTLIAQEGAQPPDTAVGAKWKSFTSVAASDKGVLFVAKLAVGARGAAGPGGITTAKDTGLWAVTTSGSLRKLIAEGDTLDTKTVKTFTVLTAASGSQGIRRSFATHGTAIVRVTFTNGDTSLYEITVP